MMANAQFWDKLASSASYRRKCVTARVSEVNFVYAADDNVTESLRLYRQRTNCEFVDEGEAGA